MAKDRALEQEWTDHLTRLGVSAEGTAAYLALSRDGREVPTALLAELVAAHLVTRDGREALPIRAATAAWVAKQQVDLLAADAMAHSLSRATLSTSGPSGVADFIEVVSGAGMVTELFGATHRSAKREVRVFDRPPYLSGPDTIQVEPTQPEMTARGVHYRAIYPMSLAQEQMTYDIIASSVAMGETARLAPTLPLRMVLIDDTSGLIVLPRREDDRDGLHSGPNVDAMVVHPSTFLDALQELFETTWASAMPFVTDEGSAAWTVDPVDRRILALMNTGLTDQRIAQVVGISERTVARRINRLQEQLSVNGRFALGVRAATDGLL